MDANTYQKNAVKTLSKSFHIDQVEADILHGAVGVATEAGELLDALKKTIFYGKKLDLVNIEEEIGDVLWYLAIMCENLGVSMEDIMEKNINKLNSRYPDKFTEQDALDRDLETEREILEAP